MHNVIYSLVTVSFHIGEILLTYRTIYFSIKLNMKIIICYIKSNFIAKFLERYTLVEKKKKQFNVSN